MHNIDLLTSFPYKKTSSFVKNKDILQPVWRLCGVEYNECTDKKNTGTIKMMDIRTVLC